MIRALLLALLWPLLAHAATVRDQEIAECRPGDVATWGDGADRPAVNSPLLFAYDHALAPAWFSEAEVREAIAKAAAAWSQCGVQAYVLKKMPAGAVRVQWNDAGSAGNFGLADLGRRTLSLSPAAFGLLRSRNPAYDARQTLQMVVSHEMGHLFGLMAHSRRCIDVTSYYDNGKGERCFTRDPQQGKGVAEYRSVLPTACDLQRCRIANGVQQQRGK